MLRALLFFSVVGSAASVARAEPLPHQSTVRIGRPPRAVSIRVTADETGAAIAIGNARADGVVPVPSPTSATVERVELAGGGAVAIVRVDNGSARGAALVGGRGRPQVLWTGRLDATGDPGERHRDVIEVADRDGDRSPDVVVGVMSEAATICGQRETLLVPRAVDPRTIELRDVALRRLPEGVDEVPVVATLASPGPSGAPLLPALHFRTASSSAGSPDEPGLVPPPLALADGSADTVWREGRPGAGRWEFATAAFTGGDHRVRALAFTMPAADAGAVPKQLYVVPDRGPRLHVTFPAPIATPGARLWVTPPAAVNATCLSIVLDETGAGSGPTALAEVQAYTDLDFGEGLSALIEDIVADTERGAEAARLLATLGEPAVIAVREAWETLTPTGRRRSLRVFTESARDVEAAREGLVIAARDEDADVRTDALAALADTGESAIGAIAELVTDPRAGDDAAIELARRHPAAATPTLLAAFAREGGSERPALRRALATAASRGGADARAAVERWIDAGPPTGATASAALALARDRSTHSAAATLLARGVARAERFEDRWRLVLAAKALGSEASEAGASVDAWLASTAADAEEWMLRAAALEALAARGAEQARDVAREALEDPYPRVRVAALELLGSDGEMVERIAVAARRDGWPMVRAKAVAALADDPRALPVVRAAVDDPSKAVRAAAIRALTAARDRESVARVAARLEDGEELAEVWSAAIDYARTLCVRELAEPIAEVLRHGMRPNAWATDVEVAVEAVHALSLLGGEEADDALDRAASELAPPAIRAAAHQARRTVQNCR